MKFINSLGKGWGNVKSCLQNNGSLKKLTKSEKEFVTIVSRNVDGYLSYGVEKERNYGKNICLINNHNVECDEGYWSSGLEEDDEYVEPNYWYKETNDPPRRSII